MKQLRPINTILASGLSLSLSLGLAAGCAGTVPAPPNVPELTAPPVAAVTATAAPVATAAPSSAPSLPPAPLIAIPPPLTEPLAPLNRSFVKVTLPGVKRSVTSVSGRGPRDVWFLTHEEVTDFARTVGGDVLRYDGKTVKSFGHPCSSSMFGGIVVAKSAVVVLGYRPWSRGVWPSFRASLTRDDKWDCSEDEGGGYRTGLTRATREHVWKLSCSGADCRLDASAGPAADLPSYHTSFNGGDEDRASTIDELWMSGQDDGWMIHADEDERQWLLRYNGVTWTRQAALDPGLAVVSMWADDQGHVWLPVRRGGKDDDPATIVLRFDGKALSALPVPASFAASLVRGTSSRDVWFMGNGKTVYQWDGQQLRQGEAPFEVGDAWGSPGDALWITGLSPESGGPGPGVTAHTAPLPAAPAASASAGVKQ